MTNQTISERDQEEEMDTMFDTAYEGIMRI